MGSDSRHLSPHHLFKTADRVASRVAGRFPEASLGKVAQTVAEVTREAIATAEKINRPNWFLRGGLIALAVLVLAVAASMVGEMPGEGPLWRRVLDLLRLTQGAAVWLGALVVFCWTLETRFKRGKAIRALHDLRALAHIVDMHQLAKDPENPGESDPAYASPEAMTQYLHYCSELLALLSKVGQLYVEDFPDGTTLAAVDQLENLTTGLSQKIWQKLMILDRIRSDEVEEMGK